MYSDYLKYIDGTALQEVETFVKETGEGQEYEDFGKVSEEEGRGGRKGQWGGTGKGEGRGGRGKGEERGGKGERGDGGRYTVEVNQFINHPYQ